MSTTSTLRRVGRDAMTRRGRACVLALSLLGLGCQAKPDPKPTPLLPLTAPLRTAPPVPVTAVAVAAVTEAWVEVAVPTAQCKPTDKRIVEGTWGTRLGQFSSEWRTESESPASAVDVSADERQIFVLDSTNRRIQVFVDGKATRAIPLESNNAEDFRLVNEQLGVLFPKQAELQWLDASGSVQQRVSLPMFANIPSEFGYLDAQQGQLSLRTVDATLLLSNPANQATDSKLPVPASARGLSVDVAPGTFSEAPKTGVRLNFGAAVHALPFVARDDAGRVYVETWYLNPKAGATLVILTPAGELITSLHFPPQAQFIYEMRRHVRVLKGGDLLRLHTDARSAWISRYDWQQGACAGSAPTPKPVP
jgi:hypothetical protein